MHPIECSLCRFHRGSSPPRRGLLEEFGCPHRPPGALFRRMSATCCGWRSCTEHRPPTGRDASISRRDPQRGVDSSQSVTPKSPGASTRQSLRRSVKCLARSSFGADATSGARRSARQRAQGPLRVIVSGKEGLHAQLLQRDVLRRAERGDRGAQHQIEPIARQVQRGWPGAGSSGCRPPPRGMDRGAPAGTRPSAGWRAAPAPTGPSRSMRTRSPPPPAGCCARAAELAAPPTGAAPCRGSAGSAPFPKRRLAAETPRRRAPARTDLSGATASRKRSLGLIPNESDCARNRLVLPSPPAAREPAGSYRGIALAAQRFRR